MSYSRSTPRAFGVTSNRFQVAEGLAEPWPAVKLCCGGDGGGLKNYHNTPIYHYIYICNYICIYIYMCIRLSIYLDTNIMVPDSYYRSHIQVGSLEVGSFHTTPTRAPTSPRDLIGVVWEHYGRLRTCKLPSSSGP